MVSIRRGFGGVMVGFLVVSLVNWVLYFVFFAVFVLMFEEERERRR